MAREYLVVAETARPVTSPCARFPTTRFEHEADTAEEAADVVVEFEANLPTDELLTINTYKRVVLVETELYVDQEEEKRKAAAAGA